MWVLEILCIDDNRIFKFETWKSAINYLNLSIRVNKPRKLTYKLYKEKK